MGNDALRGDTTSHYDAIMERNRDTLRRLTELAKKSAWAEHYLPIRPRGLTVALMNGFRVAAGREKTGDAYRTHVANIVSIALANRADESVERAVAEAIGAARRSLGLLDPTRRGTDPDPQLTAEEQHEIEMLLRKWLYAAMSEFGPNEFA